MGGVIAAGGFAGGFLAMMEATGSGEVPGTPAAANRADFEKYKAKLRAQMGKPDVKDSRLAAHFDQLYRADARIGSGSTADAIRHELATREPVGGVFHSQKGRDAIAFLERWLRNNPNAAAGDRAAAENVLQDLRDALGQ